MKCKYKIDGIDVYKYIMPVIRSNMYIMLVDNQALIIDPNINEDAVDLLKDNHVKMVTIILTHEHYDHISGVNYFRKYFQCMVIGNEKCKDMTVDPTKNMAAFFMAMFIDKSEAERQSVNDILSETYSCNVDLGFINEKEYVIGSLHLLLRETPGHSPGSICIEVNRSYVFSGDSLVDGAKIITRLPGGNKKDYQEITRPYLESLDDNIIIFPGHGNEGKISEFKIG